MFGVKAAIQTIMTLFSRVLKFVNDSRLKKAGADEERLRLVAKLEERKRAAEQALEETISDERKDVLDDKFNPFD